MARGKFSGQYVVIETTHGFHSAVRTWLRLRCFHKSRDWDGLPPGPLVNGHFANWSSVQCTFSSPQALGWILRGKVGLPTNFFSYTSWHRSKLTGFILSYFWKLFHKNFPFFKTDGFPKHYIALLSQNCQSVFFWQLWAIQVSVVVKKIQQVVLCTIVGDPGGVLVADVSRKAAWLVGGINGGFIMSGWWWSDCSFWLKGEWDLKNISCCALLICWLLLK